MKINLTSVEQDHGIQLSGTTNDLIVAGLSFVLSLANFKQMSYLSRIFMGVAVVVIIYMFVQIMLVYFFIQSMEDEPGKLIVDKFNYEKPIFPYFYVVLAMGNGIYEGITIVPALYSNSRRQDNFLRMTSYSLTLIAISIISLAAMSLLSFKSQIEEIIFLNLRSGEIQNMIVLAYSATIIQQEAINIIPIVDIYANYKHRFFYNKEEKNPKKE